MPAVVIRVRSPKIVDLIESHLVFHDPSNKPIFIEALVHWMVSAPDSVCVTAAMDGDEVVGYVIAQSEGPTVPWANVAQAWSKIGNPPATANEMFFRTVLWACSMGKTSLRAETLRDEAMFRRFGFVPSERVVRFKINDQFLSELFTLKGSPWEASSAE